MAVVFYGFILLIYLAIDNKINLKLLAKGTFKFFFFFMSGKQLEYLSGRGHSTPPTCTIVSSFSFLFSFLSIFLVFPFAYLIFIWNLLQ